MDHSPKVNNLGFAASGEAGGDEEDGAELN